MENICLRAAENGDWRPIASLLHENQLPQEGARVHLADFLVATNDGNVVGCACVEVYGDIALLRSVAVAPALRGKGIGKGLVARLVAGAKQRKIAKVYLQTVGAETFFAHLGFRAEPLAAAPRALQASAQFQGACPSSATLLSLTLAAAPV